MAPARKKQRVSAGKDGAGSRTAFTVTPETASPTVSKSAAALEDDSVAPTTSDKPARPVAEAKALRTVFVRSLPPTTTTENLTELFSQSRPLRHATAVLDPATGQCKGYGFVTFADAEDAAAAQKEFHAYALTEGQLGYSGEELAGDSEDSKPKKIRLRVDIAEPRKRKITTKFDAGGLEIEPTTDDAAKVGEKRKRGHEGDDERGRVKRDLETGSKVIVRNLPWSIKSGEQLGKHFEKWGKLKGAVVPKKNGGLLQGFGFITFKSRKAAERAIKEGNGLGIDGRQVAIDWAVQRDAWRETQESGQAEGADEAEDTNMDDVEGEDLSSGLDAADDEDGKADSDNDDDGSEEELDGDEKTEEDDDEAEDRSGTLFIRNLPFTCEDEDLEDAFRPFGAVRYARVVMDHATNRSRGTGFVCFYSPDDAEACVRAAPRPAAHTDPSDKAKTATTNLSVLQDESRDPTGKYTLEGRILQVSKAVDKREASRLTVQGAAARFDRDKDRRRLYLLSEGTINSRSALWQRLSPMEQQLRDASAKQRRNLIESNPSLQVSLTRLSIRNLPRSITSKDLKQLAREAVVGFAIDVRDGKRTRISREELARGGEEMQAAEQNRRDKKQGVVRQAKVVFEGREGGKVDEKSGAGRSRGYGFIEYHTHRNALMGLRWLNGHLLDYKAVQSVKGGKGAGPVEAEDRKKRLIVEFAIENRQVVMRRKEREEKAQEDRRSGGKDGEEGAEAGGRGKGGKKGDKGKSKRNKGGDKEVAAAGAADGDDDDDAGDENKLAKRARIIQKKRMMRRAKKQGREWRK